MRNAMDVIRAMADESRVRILMALRGRELCVCQLTALLELAPSTVSKHMAVLRQARLVESRKEGRWIYYRLSEAEATDEAREAQVWLARMLENAPAIVRDEDRLREIEAVNREDLCHSQS